MSTGKRSAITAQFSGEANGLIVAEAGLASHRCKSAPKYFKSILIALVVALAFWGFGYTLSRYAAATTHVSYGKLWDKHDDTGRVRETSKANAHAPVLLPEFQAAPGISSPSTSFNHVNSAATNAKPRLLSLYSCIPLRSPPVQI